MPDISLFTDRRRIKHFSEMPLGLVGEEWEPGRRLFEHARASTAKAMTRLAKAKVETDGVMDWEVRSWLREQHYGDPSMAGLRAAALNREEADRHG
ncbi:hypothetical protein [Methylobacterium sp. B4]|uniref:hypothetical protein n=1 Tax=Methylobacterium sp. B4 TaxID=1938755 RepID=UPI000D7511B1|nr:hypothetical protein [Methylobacterium sp. B4]PXW55592.1 hypothetical protein BY998_11876 [Methylobacterium sp. B4]